MFCSSCGSPINEGEKFCQNCGAPATELQPQDTVTIEKEPITENNDYSDQVIDQCESEYSPSQAMNDQYNDPYNDMSTNDNQDYYSPQFNIPDENKKTSKKKIIIPIIAGSLAIIIAAAVVLILTVFNKPSISELEKSNMHAMLTAIEANNSLLDFGSSEFEIEPQQALLDLTKASGIDLSWLKKISISLSSDIDNNKAGYKTGFSINDKDIATLDTIIDKESSEMLLYLEDYSDSVGTYDLSQSSLSGAFDPDITSKLFSSENIGLFEKYYGIAMDGIETSSVSNGTFRAGDASQDCKILTANLSQKDILKIKKALFETAVNDAELKDCFLKKYGTFPFSAVSGPNGTMSADEAYDMYKQDLSDELESIDIENASNEIEMILNDYVSKNVIIGRIIEFKNTSDITGTDTDTSTTIKLGFASNNNSFGLEFTVNDKAILLGSGTINNTVINCDMSIFSEDKEIIALSLRDFDFIKVSGDLEITPSAEIWGKTARASSFYSILSTLKIKLHLSKDDKAIEISAASTGILDVAVRFKESEPVSIDSSLPKVDAEEWFKSIDFTVLSDKLQDAGFPQEYLTLLKTLVYAYAAIQ